MASKDKTTINKTTTNKPPAFTPDKFDIKKFSVELKSADIDKQDKKNNPKMPYWAIPKYEYNIKSSEGVGKQYQPFCVTGDIKIVKYGIPRNSTFPGVEPMYKTERERQFIRVPFDPDQPACVELQNMAIKLDEYMDNNKAQVLSGIPVKNQKKCNYTPLNKEPSEKEKEPKFHSLKIGLDADYETGNISTLVYVKQPNGTNELQKVTSLKELEQYLKWGCTFRCAFMINKMWVMKGKDKYGLKLTCYQLIIKQLSPSGNSVKSEYKNALIFDNEGEEQTTTTTTTIKKEPVIVDKDDEPEKNIKVSSKTAPKKSSDSDQEDEKKGSTKKEDNDDESDTDDDDNKSSKSNKSGDKKVTSKVAKKKASKESDDESEEDD